MLALRVVLAAELVISCILPSISLILALYTSSQTTRLFNTSLSLLKSTGTGTNLSTFYLSSFLFKLFKPISTFSNL